MVRKSAVLVSVTLGVIFMARPTVAASLTEQDARTIAAWWVQGSLFKDIEKEGADTIWDRYHRSANPPFSEIMTAKTKELLGHIEEALLVVRGNTGYCGPIKEPTWLIIGDKFFADMNGGYPVMINARTGKILDCRS